MHKIYSRPRIRIPRILIQSRGKITNPKAKKILPVICILIIAFATVKFILDAILPVFDTMCENRASSIATMISNEQATNVMKEHSYDEFFTIEKDNEGNISMIKSNIVPINEITSNVANKIQEEMNRKGREKIEIPIRKFYRI